MPSSTDHRAAGLRVFLCHSSDDKEDVRSLYHKLKADGFAPWLDEEDLVPGQDWGGEIRRAVRAAHAVVVCLSASSTTKDGYVHKEIRFALDVAEEKRSGTIYIIPALLARCAVPEELRRWHWVNLFEPGGYERLVRALRHREDEIAGRIAHPAQEDDETPGEPTDEKVEAPFKSPLSAAPSSEALRSRLYQLVVGQGEAVEAVVSLYEAHLAGLRERGRTSGNLLLLGPTGSGKTRLVEVTAESLVGTTQAVLKIDCAEYQHSHEIAKLVGSPPGYLGFKTRPLLSQNVLDRYLDGPVKLGILLFDEIEKASDALWNLLLGILDRATLSLGTNERVDFSRMLIFLTSNLGAAEIAELIRGGAGLPRTGESPQALDRRISRTAVEAARRKFSPEFINRLDRVIVFRPLGEEELRQILDIELGRVQQRIFRQGEERSFVFTASGAARAYLLREGTDMRYGARHLKRAIDRFLVEPLSHRVAIEAVHRGDHIRIDVDTDGPGLTFVKESAGLSMPAMVSLANRL